MAKTKGAARGGKPERKKKKRQTYKLDFLKSLQAYKQMDFLKSLFGGGESFPLALPMKPLIPTPPKNIFPPDFLASAAHFGGMPPVPLELLKTRNQRPPRRSFSPEFLSSYAHFGGVPPVPPEWLKPPEGLFESLNLPNIPDMGSLFPESGYQNAFGFGGKRKMARTAGRIAGRIKGFFSDGSTTTPPPENGGAADGGDKKSTDGNSKQDGDNKEEKGANKRLDKILRLLNLLTKGKARFITDAVQAARGGVGGGGGGGDLPGAEMLGKFAPAIAAFVAAVKVFDLAAKDRQERGSVEQRAAALGMDAKKAFSADVTMKAFGGNFESIAKPMVAWADAMTGVQMGDAGKFSNIMKQVAELSGMGYNVDLRNGSGKLGMASNEEFFTRMADALSQAIQKGDIGAQQKIQSIAGFDSSIADALTSVKGSSGSDILKYAFSRQDSMAVRSRAANRYGRRAVSAGWDSLKDTAGAIGSAALDVLTGPVITEALEPVLNTNEARVNEHNLPKKAKGGRETRPAIFAEAGPEWFIPEKNDENSRALLISAAQACGFDMFASGGSRRLSRSLGFKGPNNDWRAKRRGLLGGSRTTAESLGFRGPNHDWRVNNRTFSGNGARMSERLGFKGPSPVNHTNTVTMNISKVEVSANNAKEFAESMLKARQNPLSNVAKSIASSVDTKRIA